MADRCVIRSFVCEHFGGNYKAAIFLCIPYMHVLWVAGWEGFDKLGADKDGHTSKRMMWTSRHIIERHVLIISNPARTANMITWCMCTCISWRAFSLTSPILESCPWRALLLCGVMGYLILSTDRISSSSYLILRFARNTHIMARNGMRALRE